MTNRILQSDIDAAKRLIEARHTDEEIVAALTRRKIELRKAEQLVAALRAGIRVEPEIEINYELGQGSPEHAPVESDLLEPPPQRRRKSASSGKGSKWLVWLVLLLLIGAAAAYFWYSSQQSQNQDAQSGTPVEETNAPADDASPAVPKTDGPAATPPATQ